MQVNTRLLMRAGTALFILGLVLTLVSDYVSDDTNMPWLLGIGFVVSGTIAFLLAFTILPDDFYPVITRQVFRDYKDFEDFKNEVLDMLNPDMERIVWYVYNLPPNDFLNFVRLIVEMRDAANDEGLRRIAQHMRKQ